MLDILIELTMYITPMHFNHLLEFGFLQPSFSGVEKGTSDYDIPIGFQSGSTGSFIRLEISATPGTAGEFKTFFCHHYILPHHTTFSS